MIVTLPLPPKELSPNARCHWAVKSRKVRKYREDSFVAAVAKGINQSKLKEAEVQCVFYFRHNRRRDGDNLLASMKSAFDGLVDAGVFTDDSGLTHLPVVQGKDKSKPRVEIHITCGS